MNMDTFLYKKSWKSQRISRLLQLSKPILFVSSYNSAKVLRVYFILFLRILLS